MGEQYPINVNTKAYKENIVNDFRKVAELGLKKEWTELLEFIDGDPQLINSCALVEENIQHTLNTPLHHAALGSAPEEVFEQLLEMGSAKCLKNATGETAYDVAAKSQLSQDILKMIEVPQEIKQKEAIIAKLEEGLNKTILGRVENLIKKNDQALPQVAYLFEKGEFYYPVPGMYGGFNVTKNEDKGIVASSWIRVCGGSGQEHEIDNDGNVKLVNEGFV